MLFSTERNSSHISRGCRLHLTAFSFLLQVPGNNFSQFICFKICFCRAAGLWWRGCGPPVTPCFPPHSLRCWQLWGAFQQGLQVWAGQETQCSGEGSVWGGAELAAGRHLVAGFQLAGIQWKAEASSVCLLLLSTQLLAGDQNSVKVKGFSEGSLQPVLD